MSYSLYIEDVQYFNPTILVRIRYRSKYLLSYLNEIKGAFSSDEGRTWHIPLTDLAGFYKFAVRWHVSLPENLHNDIERRIKAGQVLPVRLNVFKNPRRTRLCRKHKLPILDDLVFEKRSREYGSWRRRGRYAIATPGQRKIILDAERAAIEETRQRHEKWLSAPVSDHLLCCALSTIGQEIVRLCKQEEDMRCTSYFRSYAEGASLFFSQAMQTDKRRKELRMLYDFCLEDFVVKNGLIPFAWIDITQGQAVKLYEFNGQTLYSFHSNTFTPENEECIKLTSRNGVSLERAVFILMSNIRTQKESLSINPPSGIYYARFLSAFVQKEENSLRVNLESILQAIDFENLPSEGLSATIRSIYALEHEIPTKTWFRYFKNCDLSKLRLARPLLPPEAVPLFDDALTHIEKSQKFGAELQNITSSFTGCLNLRERMKKKRMLTPEEIL
jgi:hypothetical protein